MGASEPVAIMAQSSTVGSLTVADCTFNGNELNIPSVQPPPAGTGIGSAIEYFGSGTFTAEYNYIYGMPADGIDLGGGTITPTIEYNLFDGLGYTPGSHPDPIQFDGDVVNNALIAFNTIYQPQGVMANEGLTVHAEDGSTITNSTVANNVVIATGPSMSMTLNIGLFQDSGNVLNGAVITNNYLDPTATFTSTGFGDIASEVQGTNLTITNNINLLTGSITAPSAGTFATSDVKSVVASPSNGTEAPGNSVTFTVNFDQSMTVTGTPTLSLNDGGTATYTGGSGTNALTFSYTVGTNDSSVSALAITRMNLPSGSTINNMLGDAANTSGAATTFSGLKINTASSAATITSIAESPASGDLNAGKTVTLTIAMSEVVTVNTTGGTPTLTLNDGGTATYSGGSGSNALTFSYTVAAGQNTADLAATTVNLNSATVKDGAGNAANLSLSGLTQSGPQIDTTTPTVSAVTTSGSGITSGSGDLTTGKTVTFTIAMSEAVTVNTTGGRPTLTLNDGGTATYSGGSGSNALTFSYTVAAGQNTADLAVTSYNANGGAIADGAGNAATMTGVVTNPTGTLQIDTTTPTVSAVTTSGSGITSGSGDLTTGAAVTFTIAMSEAVTVNTTGGTPTLTLNDGGTATYSGGSSSNALTFSYTVAAGQNTADLAVTSYNANGGAIADGAGKAATMTGAVTNPTGTLQIDTTTPTVSAVTTSGSGITSGSGDLGAGKTVTFTIAMSEAVTVNTTGGTPTLTLNDGGTATYSGGSGSNALTFSYTVAAGQNTADLAVTSYNANGGAIADGAGKAATMTGAVTNPTGTLQIDTTAPTIASLTESPASGDLGTGHVVTLTLAMSAAVTVSGRPTLTLNDGGTATYSGGSGTNTLTFRYTVGAGQNTAALQVTGVTGTITDLAGNAANLSLSGLTQNGPQIDTSTPSISSIAESPSSGDLNAGKVVTITLDMSENVTINTSGGSPTVTLNDGGTATYSGGSGTSALAFSYTVLSGQNTPDLMTTAVNLNGATITDGAGNAVNLSLAGLPQGSPQIDTTPPTLASVSATAGDYDAGKTVTLTLAMSEAVTVSGTPTLTLNDGGTANYVNGSGTNTLTFSYTVGAGQNTAALAVTTVNGTITDLAGNALSTANMPETFTGVSIDTTSPTVPAVIQTDGSTSLDEVGSNYFLYAVGTTTGPELQYNGAAITAGQYGGWTPIGAVQTASGYDVAWKEGSANEYTVWSLDSSGNWTSNLIGAVSGTSLALEQFELVFNQDLNGDGVIGLRPTVIQTDGSTSLDEIGSNYFLYAVGTTTGPELQYNGAAITAGQYGGWTPIGAVQTASGYDVAWKEGSANEYTVWSLDSSGNWTSNLIGAVSGTSLALEQFELVFNQDLNGDGVIGLRPTVIQTDGSTSLDEIGSNYFLYAVGTTTGPELQYNGAAITAGQYGGWTPIGAVQTASGYDVAWKEGSANEYTVWSLDSSGNWTSNLIGAVSGTSLALEQFELVFNQDLNGDGVVGLYAAPGTALLISSPLTGTSGSATIGAGATLEFAAADSASVTFSSATGMLKLDSPSTFSGEIFNFTGNGNLSGSDQIDLKGINYNTVHDSYANGVLTVTDGSGDTAKLSFNGSYTLANFDFASDGSGGTIVYDPPVPTSSSQNTPASGPNATSSGQCQGPATIGAGATLELGAADTEFDNLHRLEGNVDPRRLDTGWAGPHRDGFRLRGAECHRSTWDCLRRTNHAWLFTGQQSDAGYLVDRGRHPRCQYRAPGQLYGVEFCHGGR